MDGQKISNGTALLELTDDATMQVQIPFLSGEIVFIPVGSVATLTLSDTLEQVQDLLTRILEAASVVAVDICGELSPSKGGGQEDLRINYETNKALYTHVIKHL